uniref:Uncharacterized protein n=1 Tax=Sus scrofa TaxID=9823 RepID=A0A8D0X1R2_PIG
MRGLKEISGLGHQVAMFMNLFFLFAENAAQAPDEKISPFADAWLQEMSALLHIDAVEFAKIIEEEQKDQEKMQKAFNSQMRSEAKRLKTFVTYESYSLWTPQEMAAAGFYFTGIKSGVQCFCCRLVLFGTKLYRHLTEDHKKFHPDCVFLLGKDKGNIAKYDMRVKNPENTLRVDDKARYKKRRPDSNPSRTGHFMPKAHPQGSSQLLALSSQVSRTPQCFSCGG